MMHYITHAWTAVSGSAAASDLLKTVIERVLGWPVAALALGLIFRKPITTLLARVGTI